MSWLFSFRLRYCELTDAPCYPARPSCFACRAASQKAEMMMSRCRPTSWFGRIPRRTLFLSGCAIVVRPPNSCSGHPAILTLQKWLETRYPWRAEPMRPISPAGTRPHFSGYPCAPVIRRRICARPIVANMIIITTPTGAIGHQVLEHLLRAEEPVPRDRARPVAPPDACPRPNRCRAGLARRSHRREQGVRRAQTPSSGSCRRIRAPRPWTAAYLDFTRPACAAFKTQGIERVVGISALGRGRRAPRTPGSSRPHSGWTTSSRAREFTTGR